jgi:hypothetical protein
LLLKKILFCCCLQLVEKMKCNTKKWF